MTAKTMENRKRMVLAMEMLVRSINNEDIMMSWLYNGVADGDISDYSIDTNEVDDYYIEGERRDDSDKNSYKQLMSLFLRLMYKAYLDGGICDSGIVSRDITDDFTKEERELRTLSKAIGILSKYEEDDLASKVDDVYGRLYRKLNNIEEDES